MDRTPTTPKAPSPGEDVLRVIADVESQLAQLRQFHAEHQGRREELEQLEASLRAAEASIGEREARLADATKAAEATRNQIEAQRAAFALRERELTERENACQARGRELVASAQAFEADRRALAELQASVGAREGEIEAARAAVASEKEAVGRARAELQASERAASESAARAEREAAAHREKVEKLEAAVRALNERADRAAEEGSRAVESAANRHREELEARDCIISEQAQEINDHREKLAVAKTKLQEVSEALKERMLLVTTGGPQAEALRADLARREQEWAREREALAAKVAELSKPGGGNARAALAQAEQVVAGLNREIEQLRSRLSGMERENARLSTRVLEADRKGGRSPGGSAMPERIRRRQDRLALVRRLVQEREAKLAQAGEILHERAEECSRILAQRGELAQAHQAIVAMRRAAEVRSARGKSSALVFYGVLTIALILGLSWTIADQVAPATYLSRATVSADARGGTLADGELEEWQRFHEGLLADPQFIEQAAEHMKRRGLASLSTPGSLRARMDADLMTSSGSPGELVLEWRGQGAGHSARELDTLATALSSKANSARSRRVDGAATIVSIQAVPIGEPIADSRPLYAAIIAAVGSALAITVGTLIWKRLSSAKQRFERESQLEEVLDASNWPPGSSPA